MAISVEIKGGNIASAVKQLRKLCLEADMQKEIRKRQHHLNKSERRFEEQTIAYNRAMGRTIRQRLGWLTSRKLIK